MLEVEVASVVVVGLKQVRVAVVQNGVFFAGSAGRSELFHALERSLYVLGKHHCLIASLADEVVELMLAVFAEVNRSYDMNRLFVVLEDRSNGFIRRRIEDLFITLLGVSFFA